MQPNSDKEAIQNIKKGRIDYFSILVKKYAALIKNFVSQKVFDKSEVEDIVQLSFIKFYRSISRFDEKKPVLPYLYQIVRNELKMYFRSYKKTIPLDDRIQEDVEKDFFSQEKTDLKVMLVGLTENQKKVLELLYEGYSYQDIAKKLEKPINTVRTLIRRARLQVIKTKKV